MLPFRDGGWVVGVPSPLKRTWRWTAGAWVGQTDAGMGLPPARLAQEQDGEQRLWEVQIVPHPETFEEPNTTKHQGPG